MVSAFPQTDVDWHGHKCASIYTTVEGIHTRTCSTPAHFELLSLLYFVGEQEKKRVCATA